MFRSIKTKMLTLKDHNSKFSILFLALSVFVLSLFIIISKPNKSKKIINDQVSKVGKKASKDECKEYDYIHQNDYEVVNTIEIMDENEIKKIKLLIDYYDLSREFNFSLLNYDYYYPSNTVAYVSRSKISETDYYKMTANIYTINSKRNTVIFEMTPVIFEGREYSIRLNNVTFSQDGTLLAITTSEKLYIYDLSSKTLDEKFYIRKDVSEGVSGIFSYSVIAFSPDNSKVLMTRNYYEGGKYFIYDNKSKNIIELPEGFVKRKLYIPGWFDNKLVLIRSTDGRTSNVVKLSTSISLFSLTNSIEEKLTELVGAESSSYDRPFIKDGNVFIVTRNKILSDQKACDSVGNVFRVTTNYDILNRVNLTSRDSYVLLTQDATRIYKEDGIPIRSFSSYFFEGKEHLILNIWEGWGMIALLDPDKPNVFREIKLLEKDNLWQNPR